MKTIAMCIHLAAPNRQTINISKTKTKHIKNTPSKQKTKHQAIAEHMHKHHTYIYIYVRAVFECVENQRTLNKKRNNDNDQTKQTGAPNKDRKCVGLGRAFIDP